jgi:hypothetical protein
VFFEYVDLLRGVALRSIGLHDDTGRISDVFLLADALPQLWGTFADWTWQSLAVPSRIEQNESTQASVLRIGFPEWTVWALPLLQHEFGHVVIEKHKAKLPVASPTEATILADALAGLVTGPAYACAELLMRLNPTEADDGGIETLRSATILAALERSAELAQDAELKALAGQLGEEWGDALLSVGRNPAAVDAAKASPDVQDVIDTAADFLRMEWTGEAPKPPYWAEKWASIKQWSQLLREDRGAEMEVETVDRGNGDRPVALAFLLNAAWLARLPAAGAGEPDAQQLNAIAGATVSRMLELVKPGGDQATGRSSRQ